MVEARLDLYPRHMQTAETRMEQHRPVQMLEKLQQQHPVAFDKFWNGLLTDIFTDPIDKKTHLMIGGLPGVSKSTLAAQILAELEQNPAIKENEELHGKKLHAYYFGGLGKTLEIAQAVGIIKHGVGEATDDEYHKASLFTRDLLFLGTSILPDPSVIILDSIMVTSAMLRGKIVGTDRGFSTARALGANTKSPTCILLHMDEKDRSKVFQMREEVSSALPGEVILVQRKRGIYDARNNAEKIRHSNELSGNERAKQRNDQDVDSVMLKQINAGQIGRPIVPIRRSRDFQTHLEVRTSYLVKQHYPRVLREILGERAEDHGFVFHYNPDIQAYDAPNLSKALDEKNAKMVMYGNLLEQHDLVAALAQEVRRQKLFVWESVFDKILRNTKN